MASDQPISVLFVCTANLCRSPTAHGVFEDFLRRAELESYFHVDSAGTNVSHPGNAPEERAQQIAIRAGYDLSHLQARPLEAADFDNFQYIICMDSSHVEKVRERQPPHFLGSAELLLHYCGSLKDSEVPDPYYGSLGDFKRAMLLIEEGCVSLLEDLVERHLEP